MNNVYDYAYRMVLLRENSMPRNRYDMLSLLPDISIMKKSSLIVEQAARIVSRPFPGNEDIRLDTMTFHSPVRISDQSSRP